MFSFLLEADLITQEIKLVESIALLSIVITSNFTHIISTAKVLVNGNKIPEFK